MTDKCCVLDCEELVKETLAKDLPLHKFPEDLVLRTKWLTSGGFPEDFKPTDDQMVCYKHFKQQDYEIEHSQKLSLKNYSVPSVFDNYQQHPDPICLDSLVADKTENDQSQDMPSQIQPQLSATISMQKKTQGSKKRLPSHSRIDLTFLPGSRLEAKDFNEKWYPARVVETDWAEREVLIHFDKWSSRVDEWIRMDSSRLRTPRFHSKEPKSKIFSFGERLLATWVDGKKYPAKVNAVLDNDKYDVLFDDGHSKILRPSKMTKLLEVLPGDIACSEDKTPFDSKQKRRDKKRKPCDHNSMDVQNIKCVAKIELVQRATKYCKFS